MAKRAAAEKINPNEELKGPEARGELRLLDTEEMFVDEKALAEEETARAADEAEATAQEISGAGELTTDEHMENLRLATEARDLRTEELGEIEILGDDLSSVVSGEKRAPASKVETAKVSLENEMRAAGRNLALLEAKLRSGKATPEDEAAFAEAQQVYEDKRLEYVGDSFERFAATQKQQIEARREALTIEKGFLKKVCDGYKKLGEMNLEKAGWKPDSKVGKIVAKMASVRTAITVGLLAGSAIVGAGTAVGLGAIAARRMLSGLGTSISVYGLSKRFSEARLDANYSTEKVATMNGGEVVEGLDKFEAEALTGGRSLEGNAAYDALQKRFIEVTNDRQLGQKEDVRMMMRNTDMSVEKRRQQAAVSNIKKGIVAGLAGIFVGSGALAKIFGHGTHFVGEKMGIVKKAGKAVVAARETTVVPNAGVVHEVASAKVEHISNVTLPNEPGADVLDDRQFNVLGKSEVQVAGGVALPQELPNTEVTAGVQVTPEGEIKIIKPVAGEAVPSAEEIKASEIVKGDSYAKVVERNLTANPEKFGYNPAEDGSVTAWARKMRGTILRENGLVSADREMRLRFDPKHPGHVSLTVQGGHISVEKTGVRDYVFGKQIPHLAETSAPAEPSIPKIVETSKFDAPVTLETPSIKVTGIPELTGEHVSGHVGAPERQLGSVVYEYKASAGAHSVAMNGGENLGKGTLKSQETINTIFKDRSKQLQGLREGYEEAHRQGQKQMETRLFTGYNAVVREANGKLGNIFKEIQPIKGEAIMPTLVKAKATLAEHLTSSASDSSKLAPPPFEAKFPAAVVDLKSGGQVEFLRDASGKLIGVNINEKLSEAARAKADKMLQGDWLKRATENYTGKETDISKFKTSILEKVRRLVAYEKVANDLVKMNAPEDQVDLVKRKTLALARTIKKTYGDDIFKKA